MMMKMRAMRNLFGVLAMGFGVGTGPAVEAGDPVIFDQIGSGPFFATALSSSQFSPGNPGGAFTTVDNFTIGTGGAGGPVHISQVQAAVAGLQNFNSFGLIDSWTVQIYSSVNASLLSLTGDVFSASFGTPTTLTTGFSVFGGSTPVELASFAVDVTLAPGDYWMTVAMGNDGVTNGTVGIAGSLFGDGPAFFSGPGIGGEPFNLSNPAAYRLFGSVVPGSGGWLLLLLGGRTRRRRR